MQYGLQLKCSCCGSILNAKFVVAKSTNYWTMFMPSEIARLVLGYLKDSGCARAINVYLTENVHLSEYVTCLKQGREYPTTIAGQSLIDILQDYCQLKAAELVPKEMGQIVDNIGENLAQIKCLASSGQIRTTPAISSIVGQIIVEKSSVHPMLLGVDNEQEEAQTSSNGHNDSTASRGQASIHECVASIASNTEDATESACRDLQQRAPELKKTMVDSSTQCSNYPSSVSGITSAVTLRADDILENSSHASTSSSTQTPNRCALRSWSSTPSRRQVDFYSSPSSMVKSAMLYNFGVEAFRTPAKDRYPADTPLKDRYLDEDGTWKSPRRKNQVPRKRLSYTPLSALKTNVSISSTPEESEGHSNDNIDVTVLLDKLLHNTALHEKIADNINKVVQRQELPNILETEQNAQVSAQPPSQLTIDEQMHEAVIRDIVDRTESDPVFEAFLNIYYDKHEGNSRDSHILGACSDYAASPDTHGTPLNAVESTGPSSVVSTPMSESVEMPKVDVMPRSVVIQEPPDSSGITSASTNSDHYQTSICEISRHCPTYSDNNMASPCHIITLPSMETSSKTFQAVSSQCVTQMTMHVAPNSDTNTVLPNAVACNSPLTSVQLPSTSVHQNVMQLQYTNAPSVASVPGGGLSYFPNVVPALNQSKLSTIFLPFYPNTGTIIGPVMTTLPVPSQDHPSGLSAYATLPKEHNNAAPFQYFKLSSICQNTPDVTNQSNPKSVAQVQISQFHESPSKSSHTIRMATSGTNIQKETEDLANKQSEKMDERATYQVPQASSFIEVTSDIANPRGECVSQDCDSSLSELLCTTSTAPAITLYGQDMQEHHMDNLALQKLLSNTSISVAGKFTGLTPVKSSSTLQFVTLSSGSILPLATNPRTLNEAINSSNPDINQSSSANQRANILRQKPTKYKTMNPEAARTRKKDSACISSKQKAISSQQHERTMLKPLDFGEHEPVHKLFGKKQMRMMDNKLNATPIENGDKSIPLQPTDKVEKKSPDCHIIAISKGIPRNMPVLENVSIIKTTLTSRCTGSNEKSPQLTSLLQSASLLKAAHQCKDVEQAVSHVRTLDFGGSLNPTWKDDSQKSLHSNDKSSNSESKSSEADMTKKPKTTRISKKITGVTKDSVKSDQNLSKGRTKNGTGQKNAQTICESEEECKKLKNRTVKARLKIASSSPSPNPKKRTSRQADLQITRTPGKKLKGIAPVKPFYKKK